MFADPMSDYPGVLAPGEPIQKGCPFCREIHYSVEPAIGQEECQIGACPTEPEAEASAETTVKMMILTCCKASICIDCYGATVAAQVPVTESAGPAAVFAPAADLAGKSTPS